MGIFNKSIPKYTGNLYNEVVVKPTVEEAVAFVDDVYDPIFNKAVRRRLMSTYGNPIGATLGGYYELINSALMGNKNQGGTMLPGIGVLSSFGRSMDKSGDIVLGTLTEGVKGLTGQGIESPLYNIFTEDEDYSGQRILAAATNSMAKLAGAPEVTEADFGGVWTLPALGIDLATDPSILGGNLTKIAKGTGPVAEAGKILTEYDDLMAKVAIDATAPGLRPLGKKFGSKLNSYISNLRSEKELQDAVLNYSEIVDKAVMDFENNNITPEQFNAILKKVDEAVDGFYKQAEEDLTRASLKNMQKEIEVSTTAKSSPPDSYTQFKKHLDKAKVHASHTVQLRKVSERIKNPLDKRTSQIGEVISFLDKGIPIPKYSVDYLKEYKDNPRDLLKLMNVSDIFLDNSDVVKFVKRASEEDSDKYLKSMRDASEIETDFLSKIPNDMLEEFHITSRQDFLDLFKNTSFDTNQTDKLNSFIEDIVNTEQKGTTKVSQSVAKLPLDVQQEAYTYVQNSISRIVTKMVDLGIVKPEDISEQTLGNIIGNLYNSIKYPKHTGFSDLDLYNLLNYYRYNSEYLKNILTDTVKKSVYGAPSYKKLPGSVAIVQTPEYAIKNSYKEPEYYANSVYRDIVNAFENIKKEGKATSATATKFLDTFSVTGVNLRELAHRISNDEYLGKIPNVYSRKFDFINAKVGDIPVYKVIEEYVDNIVDLASKYNPYEGLTPNIPLRIRNSLYGISRDKVAKSTMSNVEKIVKSNVAKQKLLDFIVEETSQYEKYIGSKIGGRLPSDTSIGYSNALNKILSRIDYNDPLSIYEFMHTKIPTTHGKVSLSDLGFEVVQLPKELYSKKITPRMFNSYVISNANLDVQYLNRLQVKNNKLEFKDVEEILKLQGDKASKNIRKAPDRFKIEKLYDFENTIESDIASLDNSTFSNTVANVRKMFEEADASTRVDFINKMLPNDEQITLPEYELYLKFNNGKNSPVFKYIKEKHPKALNLFELLSKEFRLNLKAKQDRDAVTVLDAISRLLTDADNVQTLAGGANVTKTLKLVDKLKGSVSRGSEFLSDLVYANGRKLIAYNPMEDAELIKTTLDSIRKNIAIANDAAGGEVIQLLDYVNPLGDRMIGYRLVGDQKLLKKLSKSRDKLKFYDVVWEPIKDLTPEELKFMESHGKVVTDLLQEVQTQASSYYAKLGLSYDDANWFKHSMIQTPEMEKLVKDNYIMDVDVDTSADLAQMVIDLDYFGNLRGAFNSLQNTRIYEGNISRYLMFNTDLNAITKNTFTKGVFANEKFQTAVSLFENNEFRLNTYCKNIDDVKNILNSEANMRNLTIASMQYDDAGMITGFKRYDNFNDESLAKALQDENAVFLPTHIFATLDKVCKHRVRMSNKAYAFINRYLVAPFKIGVLLNPGFLLGNLNDAGLKQVFTMSKKYGTSVNEEIANLASSVRSTIYLNNSFADVYEKYITDLTKNYGIDVPYNERIATQVAKNKRARDNFIRYLNGELTYEVVKGSPRAKIVPSLTSDEAGLSRVWIYLNAIQPTEGITKELVGDVGRLNYAKNPFDRLLYGMYHYSNKHPSTWGVFNQPISKGVFAMSEATESLARSSAILNDLKHQGIDLTEFAKALGEPNNTEFTIKMLDAVNAMHNANFDYNATSPLLEELEKFVPFPTFWLKNISYWFDMFINHPQHIDAALDVNEGLWANEDVSEDEFKAGAKARGAIPISAVREPKSGQKLSNFFKGIYKPSPLQSMFGAFNAMNHPLESLSQRTHPLIQGAQATLGKALPFTDLTTDPENIRYRPYNTNQYQPNIDVSEEEFNPLAYTAHKMNPFDRVLNTGLRTPGKVKRGEAQLSDFLPSVFQPDFSKK